MIPNVEHRDVITNGIRLHVVQVGPEEGPLAILLHGFPEFWYGWRKQIPDLANAGYRIWAPDQRGYNLSEKPRGVAAYKLDELAADVVGLIDAAGRERASVVGHDWGGIVAWWLASKYPERMNRLVVLNAPYIGAMPKMLWRNPTQLLRSWYVFFFQIPWLPEALARRRNWQMIVQALQRSSRPGTFTESDIERYHAAWSQPGAYTSMVNWYRALVQKPAKILTDQRITVPTLLIWGAKGKFLGRELAPLSIERCDDGRLIFLEEATHWVQHEEPDRVNELIDDFLRSSSRVT